VLQVGDGGTSGMLGTGAVTDNANLVFDRSDAPTVGNVISGGGAVIQLGSGTTILTGANSYGATTVAAGTLQIGNGGTIGTLGNGAVIDNGILAIDHSDGLTVANAISGSGALTVAGGGGVLLTGANSYRGGTQITNSFLELAGSGSLGSGPVYDNGRLFLNFSGIGTIASGISGNGTLTQEGAGTSILSANNSYSGGTTITAGTLQVGAGGPGGTLGSGAIVNNGTLIIDRSDSVTLANAISGSGSVVNTGIPPETPRY
jgi:fibronectin-binding autotransporter adhesin